MATSGALRRRAATCAASPRRGAAALLTSLAWALAAGCGADAGAEAASDAQDTETADSTTALDHDPYAGESTPVVARYELQGTDWHAHPFPSELRRRSDGGLDLSGFPAPREGELAPELEKFLALGEQELDGWGLSPTVYVAFEGAVAAANLPKPAQTLDKGATIQLVDVDPTSPERGRRVPLRVSLSGTKRGHLLHANLLMFQPTWGAVLRPGTLYAAVVQRSVGDTLDRPLGQAPALARALDGAFGIAAMPTDPAELRLAEQLRPLAKAVSDGLVAMLPRQIAAATVLRTGRPTAQLEACAAWVRKHQGLVAATGWKKLKDNKSYTLYVGSWAAPNFQHGTPPFLSSGGGLVFDASGQPVPSNVAEPLRIAVSVPKTPPGEGLEVDGRLPVVIFSHGTGGDYLSFTEGSKAPPAKLMADLGMVGVGIDQPLHGPRAGKEMAKEALYLASFNFVNPESGRTVFRQAALDNVALVEMIRRDLIEIPSAVTGGAPVRLDANRLLFHGHSQGGLVGPLFGALDQASDVRAFVLSGAGAGLSLTLVRRKDIVNFPELTSATLGLDEGELSEFHPAVSLIQMLVEPVDPIAYARPMMTRPPGVRPPHVLHTEGILDAATPAAASEALAVALGLHLLEPVVQRSEAMEALQVPSVKAPVFNNVSVGDHKLTGVLRQVQGGSHWVIFEQLSVGKLAADFLYSVATTGEATVPSSGL